MTSTAEATLQALLDLWKDLPALCGDAWPAIERRLERVLERLYAAVEPEAGTYLDDQLRLIFQSHPEIINQLCAPITRSGPRPADRRSALLPGIPTRSGSHRPSTGVRVRGGGASADRPVEGPDLTRLSALAGRIRDLVVPRTVTHFVDLSCPDRVNPRTTRFSLVVRLLTAPPLLPAAGVLELIESGKVLIRLETAGFDVLGPCEQEIKVADRPPVVFDLRPRKPGRYRILLDFLQDGNPVGSITHEIECVENEAAAFSSQPAALHSTAGPAPDLVLLVSTQGQRLTFTLYEQGGPPWGRNFQSPEIGNIASYASQLYGDLTGLTVRADPVAVAHGSSPVERLTPREIDRCVRILGRNLWNNLMPREFKELYAGHRKQWEKRSLLLLSDEPHVPWELLWPYGEGYDDPTPWCCTFQMTRWLRLNERGDGNDGPPTQLRMHSLAVVAPEDAKLPNARKESEEVAALMGTCGVQILTPPATLDGVMTLLETGGYDWLHVAAHGSFHDVSPDGHSALWLEGRRSFIPDSIVGPEIEAHLRKSRPAFVFNACEGGRQGQGVTGLAGWAARLIGRGAGLFAGALWEITDATALPFVKNFYARLLAGATIGKALREARLEARKTGDPTWLAYSVYAHPNATLLLPQKRVN